MNLIPTEQITEMLVAIARTRSLSEILDHLARALDAVSGVDGYWINLLDASGENLRCMKVRLMPEFHELEKSYTGQSVKLSDSQFISRTLSSRTLQRLTLDNANESEQHVLHYCKAQSLLGLPIHDPDMPEEAPIGVLVLMEKIGGRIDAAPPVVQCLMDVYYPGLTNWLKLHHLVELHREAHSEVTANRRWLNFIQELSDLTSVDKIYQLFSAELFHQLKFEIAVFVTMKDQQFTLDKIVGATPEMQQIADAWQTFQSQFPYEMKETASGAVYVLMRNQPFLVHDLQEIMHLPMSDFDRRSLNFLPRPPHTLFLSPIRYRGQAIGALGLYSLIDAVSLSENDLQLLEQLSSFLGAAIINGRLYATSQAQNAEIGRLNQQLQEKVSRLAELASTDQLTGLFNFRSFEQELNKRLRETARISEKKELSLAVFDIDHFKDFNDRYGHAVGNIVLTAVAKEINRCIRQTDMACRYGGEEFVVILPGCDLEGARLLAERIRCGVEQICIPTIDGDRHVTISAGCTVHQPEDTQPTLFSRADAALYQAKAQGRNRVCSQ